MKSNLNKTLALVLAAAALPAAAADDPARARWTMGTLCSIEAAGGADANAAVSAAFDEIDRWDRLLSLYKPASELNRLNAAAGTGPFRASAELYAQTEAALRLARDTGGAFDPTVLPLERGGAAALPLVGWSKVRLDPKARTIELPAKGMGLDFGGIGKGWALDRAAEVLRARGVTRARLNFGGQILVFGTPAEGGDWTAVIPGRPQPLTLGDGSVSSSGDAERPGHILSPFDGRPVRRTVTATAVLPDATSADAWSTALFVLGKAPPSFPGRSFFTETPPNKGESR